VTTDGCKRPIRAALRPDCSRITHYPDIEAADSDTKGPERLLARTALPSSDARNADLPLGVPSATRTMARNDVEKLAMLRTIAEMFLNFNTDT